MTPLLQECSGRASPESLVQQLQGEPGIVLLRSELRDSSAGRYSFVTARPFLRFRSYGSRCRWETQDGAHSQYGNPWQVLSALMSRYELLDEIDLPFPLGGCFGYWGYELKNALEPRLPRRTLQDLELPDCDVGLYSSLVAFDHELGKTWIIATGLDSHAARRRALAEAECEYWQKKLAGSAVEPVAFLSGSRGGMRHYVTRDEYMAMVARAQQYIRRGDIYQVNLAHRFEADFPEGGWRLYQRLAAVSPAPYAAYQDCGDLQIASSSPELFLRMSGRRISTRPIKGTRPRSSDPTRDTQWSYELQTSPKELAELVMITDLLRNDLGRVCEYGSVQVPELVRLERFAQVQHLVSTVEGRLCCRWTHLDALAACFPGGSITGAPKIRAMEIIDELEPIARGPYTGALGYLGFNQESQLSILIRSAVCRNGVAYYHTGAGIVADSNPEAEFEETLAKARGFFQALQAGAPKPSVGQLLSAVDRPRPNYAS